MREAKASLYTEKQIKSMKLQIEIQLDILKALSKHEGVAYLEINKVLLSLVDSNINQELKEYYKKQ